RGEGLPGRVWQSGKAVWIPDLGLDKNFPRGPFAKKSGLRSAMAIPILVNDEVIAIIEFFIKDHINEDEQLIHVIEAVATQLGMAIVRKRAEEALRMSEARFKELYDNVPVGYHELDIEGRITRVNQTELSMIGYTREEIMGKHVWDFFQEREVS